MQNARSVITAGRAFQFRKGKPMEQLSSIALEYRQGTSDKVYRAAIEQSGTGYVVNYAYGRRDATLNTGTKTPQPVSQYKAAGVFASLVRSKVAKGYQIMDNPP